MKTRYKLSVGTMAIVLASTSLSAQKTTAMAAGGGGSAHVKTEWVVNGANISVTYGRPALKGRSEATMMPVGQPWRTGADVASFLTTDKTLKFGTVTLAPGNYTINTEPATADWKLILGKLGSPDQWGVPYLPALELGRVPMTLKATAAPVELVTMHIDPSKDGGILRIEWGTKSASVPFTVMK